MWMLRAFAKDGEEVAAEYPLRDIDPQEVAQRFEVPSSVVSGGSLPITPEVETWIRQHAQTELDFERFDYFLDFDAPVGRGRNGAHPRTPGERRSLTDAPVLYPGEPPLRAFVSSVMDEEMRRAREEAVAALDAPTFLVPWAFEFTPASSASADWTYIEHVRRADVVLWLVGSRTTEPVVREVREALSCDKPLLVIRLTTASPDEPTRSLLDEVGLRSKWVEVPAEGVRDAVALSLADEIVRAWRAQPGRGRAALLEQQGRLSRGRCVQRWRAAGVTRVEALRLTDEPSVGAPPEIVRPTADQPLVVIEGDVGAGKSLTAERLLQEAIAQAFTDYDAPVPIWLQAREAQGDLLSTLEAAAEGLGDIARQGAVVVIDGADEVGAGAAGALLNQARVAAEAWIDMRIVITSRPLAPLERAEEVVRLPLLDEEGALAILARLTERPVSGHGWPESVKEAIRRPLFAVLLAVYLRGNWQSGPQSPGEMLRYLVRRALPDHDEPARRVLRRLGRLSTDRGDAPVPLADVTTQNELTPLRESGLIVESGATVRFGLPILTQWFAAESLASGTPTIEELLEDPPRLDLWRYALVIAIGEFSFDTTRTLLDAIVRRDPGFGSEVVTEGLPEYAGEGEGVAAPPAMEAGRKVRETTATWLEGLGPAAQLLSLARPDGTPLPLGISNFDDSLMTLWRNADDLEEDVVELPADVQMFDPPSGWGPGKLTRPTADAAWAWRWSLDEVISALKPWIRESLLRVEDGPLFEERAWAEALAVMNAGSLHPGPLPLDELEARVAEVPENTLLRDYRTTYDLRALRRRVADLRRQGATELPGPWPRPDRDINGGWVWDQFTPERLLARTASVYEGALLGYLAVVDRWLPTLAPRLTTYATLPATLVGTLSIAEQVGFEGAPIFAWHLEPEPPQSDISVALSLGEQPAGVRVERDRLRAAYERLRAFRPRARRWISASFRHEVLEVFGATPATDLTFNWLQRDLKRLKLFK